VHVTAVLAAGPGAFDQPGTLGFIVVFGMGVILYFVFRSMAKHLRKVNTAARQEEEERQKAAAGAAASDQSQDH
jgi:Na+-transporting methylmalonyl-CoA/oxaloacetate decarboxylase gamma subunit